MLDDLYKNNSYEELEIQENNRVHAGKVVKGVKNVLIYSRQMHRRNVYDTIR